MKTKGLLFIFLLLSTMTLAQGNPVTFKVSRNQVSPTEIDVVFTGTIAAGWHVYSTDIGEDGPTPATLTTEKAEGAKAVGKLKAQGKEKNVMDEIFGMQVRYFENSVRFVQRYKITAPKYHIAGFLEYGACNDEMCMPPTAVEFEYKGENTPTNLLPEEGGVTPTSQKDSMGAKVDITISRETGIDITTGKPSEIEMFLDSFPDLDELAEVELQELLAECEQKRDQLETDEPDEADEDAHDDWEDHYSELLDNIEDIEDRLDDF